jgi:hypothetical protein
MGEEATRTCPSHTGGRKPSGIVRRRFFSQERGRLLKLFRRSTLSSEIITLGELYERARFIVQLHNVTATPDVK